MDFRQEIDGIFRVYFSLFRECFLQSFGISMGWAGLACFLYFDYQIMRFPGSFIILGVVSVIFIAITAYLFPAMAHFDTNWKNIIRNSLTMAVAYPLKTALLVGILLVTFLLIFIFPISILILGSGSAYVSYMVCHKLFENLAK